MCGILGELCKDTTTDEATFKGLLNMSRHRGPDA